MINALHCRGDADQNLQYLILDLAKLVSGNELAHAAVKWSCYWDRPGGLQYLPGEVIVRDGCLVLRFVPGGDATPSETRPLPLDSFGWFTRSTQPVEFFGNDLELMRNHYREGSAVIQGWPVLED